MSQVAVEAILGRMITDERFRCRATRSLEAASLQEGYLLSPEEMRLLSRLEPQHVSELADRLNPGLCRVGGHK